MSLAPEDVEDFLIMAPIVGLSIPSAAKGYAKSASVMEERFQSFYPVRRPAAART
jgi:hypothetical protein